MKCIEFEAGLSSCQLRVGRDDQTNGVEVSIHSWHAREVHEVSLDRKECLDLINVLLKAILL